MKSITYIIPGTPTAWKRPGHVDGRFYNRQTQERLLAGMQIKNQHGNNRQFAGPLQLDIVFYFAMPKTRSKEHGALIYTPMYFRPDTSNLIKHIEDTCESILYHDDCLITDIYAKKRYSDKPYTEFTILELNENI